MGRNASITLQTAAETAGRDAHLSRSADTNWVTKLGQDHGGELGQVTPRGSLIGQSLSILSSDRLIAIVATLLGLGQDHDSLMIHYLKYLHSSLFSNT